jgi:hypothetical protein
MSSTGRNLPEHPVNALGAYDTPVPLYRAIYRKALDLGLLTATSPILEPHVGGGAALEAMIAEGHQGPIEVMDLDPTAPGLELGRRLAAEGRRVLVDLAPEDPEARAWATAAALAQGVPAHRLGLVVAGFLVRRPVLAGPELVTLGNPPYSVTPGPEVCPRCLGLGTVVGVRGKAAELPDAPRKCCPTCKPPKDQIPEGHHPTWGTGQVQPPAIAVADLHVHRGHQVGRRTIYVLRGPFREGQERFRSLYASGTLAEAWTSPRRASFAWGATDSTETAVFAWDRDRRPDPVDGPSYTGRWIEW